MSKTTERVHFRLIQMPCCKFQACWVNPRLPTFCPECGSRVYPHVREGVLITDDTAILKYDAEALGLAPPTATQNAEG